MAKQIIFNLLLYFSEALIFFYYADNFFERKYSSKKTVLICSMVYLVPMATYQLGSNILNAFVILTVNFLLLRFLFNCSYKLSIFHSTILAGLMILSEWIFISMISYVFKQNLDTLDRDFSMFVLNNLVNKFAYFLFCFVIVKLFSKKVTKGVESKYSWALAILPVSSITVLLSFYQMVTSTQQSKNNIFICTVSAFFLLFANMIVFILYTLFGENAQKLSELQAIKQQEQADKTYMEILKRNTEDFRIYTHDMKHHFENISNMSTTKEVADYVASIYPDIEKLSNVGISKNKFFDILIDKYSLICREKEISISFDVKTSNLSFINPPDLSVVISNLLDNAVEASEKSKEKYIRVFCFSQGSNMEVLQVINSCIQAPCLYNGQLVTSKKEKELHGFGIKSVVRTIKKYNGELDWEFTKDPPVFKTTIIFKT